MRSWIVISTMKMNSPMATTARPTVVGGGSQMPSTTARQSRPVESVYVIVYFNSVRVEIRGDGLVGNTAVRLAIGYTCDGLKQILGMWVEQTEGAYRHTLVQTCIVRPIRNSMAYGSWTERERITSALKDIYRAGNADAAMSALEAFEAGERGLR